MPSPASLSSPPGMTSATTTITLAVPMSSPTTRSLYSFAILVPGSLVPNPIYSLLRRRLGRGGRRPSAAPHSRPVPQVGGHHGASGRRPYLRRHLGERLHEALAARQHLPRSVPRPSSTTAPVSRSQRPAAVRRTAPAARRPGPAARTAASGPGTSPGPARPPFRALEARQVVLSSTSPTLASNTSPKLLTSRDSASAPHSATALCSCSSTRSRLGNWRFTTALRTQGTASKAARAFCRSTVKKLPASRGATLARSVAALLCVTSPCTMIAADREHRMPHHPPAPAPPAAAGAAANSTVAVRFISFTSKGCGGGFFMA